MIQKTIAEECVVQGDKVYDEVMKLSFGLEGNADVERIKSKAETAHLRVLDKAIKACAAADLASEWCSGSQTKSLRRLPGARRGIGSRRSRGCRSAVVESRIALSEEKASRDEMEEVVALIEFDPVMSELEAAIEEDEAILLQHKNAVETKILEVDSQIQALPTTSSQVPPLEGRKVL